MNFNQATIEQLAKLNDTELTNLLRTQIKAKKANGTLSDVAKLLRTLTPLLSPEQKNRLTQIIQNLANEMEHA